MIWCVVISFSSALYTLCMTEFHKMRRETLGPSFKFQDALPSSSTFLSLWGCGESSQGHGRWHIPIPVPRCSWSYLFDIFELGMLWLWRVSEKLLSNLYWELFPENGNYSMWQMRPPQPLTHRDFWALRFYYEIIIKSLLCAFFTIHEITMKYVKFFQEVTMKSAQNFHQKWTTVEIRDRIARGIISVLL